MKIIKYKINGEEKELKIDNENRVSYLRETATYSANCTVIKLEDRIKIIRLKNYMHGFALEVFHDLSTMEEYLKRTFEKGDCEITTNKIFDVIYALIYARYTYDIENNEDEIKRDIK